MSARDAVRTARGLRRCLVRPGTASVLAAAALGCALAALAALPTPGPLAGTPAPETLAGPPAPGTRTRLADASPARGGKSVAQEFAHATQPRAWEFPRDHGAHPAFATEWWYFTGIVRPAEDRAGRTDRAPGNENRTQGDEDRAFGAEARTFGYQVTFFRTALRPSLPDAASPWRARDLILAHLAVTDVRAGRFETAEDVQRAAAGLAGADSVGLCVWSGTWSACAEGDGFRLRVMAEKFGVELRLLPAKGIVLHGDRGLSRKSREGRHASYYYSMPRLRTTGSVRTYGVEHRVDGTTWMDHEFFTGDTPREGMGWDWFSARLEDGRDLMLYAVRTPGDPEPFVQGTLVEADGAARPLATAGMTATALATWTSPTSGVAYPVRWALSLPGEGIDLEVAALVPQQEVVASRTVGFSYWEGACQYRLHAEGRPIGGEGYVELTGYPGP